MDIPIRGQKLPVSDDFGKTAVTLSFVESFLIMAYSGIRGWSTFYKVRTIPGNNSLDAEMELSFADGQFTSVG